MQTAALSGRTVLVTGASRGLGRGIAHALADAGAIVYATGRLIAAANLPPAVVRITCDHQDDEQVARVFARIRDERGGLDVLVNAVWDGYQRMVENGRFVWALPFWEQPEWRWPSMMDAGVRAAYVASQHAARLMLSTGGVPPAAPAADAPVVNSRGLIVHLSHWAAQKHLGNTIYGIAKAATDKMAADMSHELRPHGVAVVSLYPGLVRTEAVMAYAAAFDLSNSESPEFTGRVIAALSADTGAMRLTGQRLVVAALAADYGITDIDGRQPRPLTLADV